jgi:hypothetical protein
MLNATPVHRGLHVKKKFAPRRQVQPGDSHSGLPLLLLIIGRLAQGTCATAQEEDRCDSTTVSTVTIAESISM